jgi:plastocyanin
MFFLRLAVLLAALTNILAGTTYAQTTMTVNVGYNGTFAFQDQATGSTSSAGNPAVTRIHEGDTVQFTWQGSNHNISPYDTAFHNTGFGVPVSASAIMASSTWNGGTRLSTYRCTLHSSMTGQVYVFEVARRLAVTAPSNVAPGSPFSISVIATGQNNTADGLYRGTIQFASSDTDPNVQLPANYTFVAGDNGTHMFNGLVLKTPAASATITVSEVGGSGLTGQATLEVGSPPRSPDNLRVIP